MESSVSEPERYASWGVFADPLLRAQDALGLAAAVFEGGKIIAANEAYARLTGYSIDEIMRLEDRLGIATPASRAELQSRVDRRARGEDVDGWFETQLARKDGSVVTVDVAVKTTMEGERTLRVALMRDVTTRQQVEAELRASEERFRRAVHDAAIGIAIYHASGAFLEINQALADMLGYSREELLGLDWRTITHPEDVQPITTMGQEVLKTVGRGYRFSKRYIHRDGHIVWAEVVSSPVRDENGKVLQYVTQVIDVSRRVEDEALLRRQKQLLAESQGASHVGSWEFVPGRGGIWSDEMYRVFGFEPQEVPAAWATFFARVPEPDQPLLQRLGSDATVADETVDHRVLHPTLGTRWVTTRAHVERDAEGRVTRLVGTTQDITERKRGDEEARRHLVQRKLVRRILRDLVEGGASSASTRRKLGKTLAAEANASTIESFAEAFAALNIGDLHIERVSEGRYQARGRDLLEVTPGFGAPTCHIALGFLEGMVTALDGRPSLGTEIRCQSQGHEACELVVRSKVEVPRAPQA
jgi:PAS domain S-box-containing protein